MKHIKMRHLWWVLGMAFIFVVRDNSTGVGCFIMAKMLEINEK